MNFVLHSNNSVVETHVVRRDATLSSLADAIKSHDEPCQSKSSQRPPNPSSWKYSPLFLCPSPNSSMKTRGVRYSSSTEHLVEEFDPEHDSLPINFGTEEEGRCLVIDFTTTSFEGTALFRIKLERHGQDECDQNQGYYFAGRKRTFQAVIKGRFLQHLPISECVTGQVFEHPPVKLPPKCILHGAVSLFKKLAPQLTIDLDGKRPKFLSPLASTAQTVICDDGTNQGKHTRNDCMELDLCEPNETNARSLHRHLSRPCGNGSSSKNGTGATCKSRIKARKKAFDRSFARGDKEPKFNLDKEYTFEFFQHLIYFDDLSVDLGLVGRHKLGSVLNSQPLKCMAARYRPDIDCNGLDFLWAFDIWHESIRQTSREAMQ